MFVRPPPNLPIIGAFAAMAGGGHGQNLIDAVCERSWLATGSWSTDAIVVWRARLTISSAAIQGPKRQSAVPWIN